MYNILKCDFTNNTELVKLGLLENKKSRGIPERLGFVNEG